jgi:hypothetical protein
MTATLHVLRWHNDIVVPRACTDALRICADLDGVAQRLGEDLATDLQPWISGPGTEVVLVRALTFDCELDVSRPHDLLTARWARAFARALIGALEDGAAQVLRFDSPAAYRAQYIADLAAGTGAGAWYYRPFAGLDTLPAGAAVRTVLLEDAAQGREILVRLLPDTWRRLAGVLTRREALRILEGLSASAEAAMASPAAQAALCRDHAETAAEQPWFVAALRLYAAALRGGLGGGADTASFARLAARLYALAHRDNAVALGEALRTGEFSSLVAVDDEHDTQTWQPLRARPSWGPVLAELVASDRRLAETPQPDHARAAHTAFGGWALLLPELDRLLDGGVSATLPDCPFARSRSVAAWLVLAGCAGPARARRFVGERFWRDFFGIPADAGRDDLLHWLADNDGGATATNLARYAEELARGEPLQVPLKTADGRCVVPVDPASGLWCGALRVACPRPSVDPSPWRARLAAARLARGDWRQLRVDWMGLPPAWQRLFTHMAQILLRRFACSMPGFAGVSLPYLQANFLAGTGDWEPDGRLRLARPPLHVMLNLTGVGRGSVRWSGPPERILVLEYSP